MSSFEPYYPADCELTSESSYLLNTSDLKSIEDLVLETVVCADRCEADEGKTKNSPASINHVAEPRRHSEVEVGFERA